MISAQWLESAMPVVHGIFSLAEGGQKWVFAGEHDTHGPVAIKIIKPNQDVERVRRELLAVQRVQCPRVPKILEAGTMATPIGTCLCVVEQRVTGRPVRELVLVGPMDARIVAHMGFQVLEALVAAEAARIVHRDVKPENIMRDDGGDFWLLDFGIARHLDLSSLTATGALGGPGTVGYAPPEQYRNHKRDLDSRADLFALAVTMVECLTGTHPYRLGARDVQDVLHRIQASPLVVPRIPGDQDDKFSDLIGAMGQRRIDCRPSGAAEALAWMAEVRL